MENSWEEEKNSRKKSRFHIIEQFDMDFWGVKRLNWAIQTAVKTSDIGKETNMFGSDYSAVNKMNT